MKPLKADLILEQMAKTFREKNKLYGDNYLKLGKVMFSLYPNGITLKTEDDFIRYHFLDWIVGKLSRFCKTNKHKDSIHDLAVYAAMLEDTLDERHNSKKLPRLSERQTRLERKAKGNKNNDNRRQKKRINRRKHNR